MKRALFALSAFVLIALCGSGIVQAAPADPSEIQRILDERANQIPGSGIVAVVIRDGKQQYYQAGVSGTARPLDKRTLFEIGSDTKTFTAAVLAEMALAGSVKLSDPVAKYLPSDVHVPSLDGKQITLLDLATQHSGLPRVPTNMDPAAPNPYVGYTPEKLYAFLDSYKLTREPGAKFEYSNLGIGLLGFALARANHMTYEEMIRTRVWRPLHMTGSAIALTQRDRARFAAGHNDTGGIAPQWDFSEPMVGAGGIRSDITDMTSYLNAAMGNGPLAKAMLFAEQPRSTFPGHHIGLVWWTNDSSHFIDHGGDTAGYHAVVLMSGDRTTGVVMMSNGPLVTDLAAHVADTQYAIVPPAKTLALTDAQLDEYVGTYKNEQAQITYTVERSGNGLSATISGQSAAGIYPSSPDHFYYNVVQAYIEFIRENGKVVGLILTQNGQHTPVYRIGDGGKPMATSLTPNYPPVAKLDAETLQSYAGTYDLGGAPLVVSVTNGHVFAKLGEQSPVEVFPSAKDAFFYEVVDAQLVFNRDSSGVVTGVTLHQNGREITAPKKT